MDGAAGWWCLKQWDGYLDNMHGCMFRGAFGGSGSSEREETGGGIFFRDRSKAEMGPTQPLGLPLAMANWPEALMGSAAI